VAELSARLGRPAPRIPPSTLGALQSYPWPGNVRELRNVIERGMILSPGDALTVEIAPLEGTPSSSSSSSTPIGPDEDLNLRAALGRREREVLQEALRRSGGVRKEAARLLGIDQRNLGYYLHKHEIDPDAVGD
jgi:DNA-binding NtrC family response regulator